MKNNPQNLSKEDFEANIEKSKEAVKTYKRMLDDPKSSMDDINLAIRNIKQEKDYLLKRVVKI